MTPSSGPSAEHRETLHRLARIEGQVRGLQRLVEQRAYCVEILNQIEAVQAALRSVALKILGKHVETCIVNAVHSGDPDDVEAKLREVVGLLKKRLR